jgi:hypothetical protein
MTNDEPSIKDTFANLLKQSRELQRSVKAAFRLADEHLPKEQRSPEELTQSLLALEDLERSLIRAKINIRS